MGQVLRSSHKRLDRSLSHSGADPELLAETGSAQDDLAPAFDALELDDDLDGVGDIANMQHALSGLDCSNRELASAGLGRRVAGPFEHQQG